MAEHKEATQHPRPWREIWTAEEPGDYGSVIADPQPWGIKDARGEWVVRYDDDLGINPAETMHELVHLSKAPELVRWMAQTVHQMYHLDALQRTITYHDCPRSICDAARQFLAGEYGHNPQEKR